MLVLARDGETLGRFDGGAARSDVRWSTGGGALLYFRTGRAREDELVRRAVTVDGAIAGEVEVIMPRTPTLYRGEFDVARSSGAVVILTGDAITDTWSFDLTRRPVAGRRETRGTTWYGDAVVSLDDRHLYYYRGDGLGDNIYRLDRRTGAEEALTAERGPGGSGIKLSSDGARLAYSRLDEGGMALQELEVTSRRVTTVPAAVLQTTIQPRITPATPRGFVTASASGALLHLDSIGGSWRRLTSPDSLVVLSHAVTADGTHAVFSATRPQRAPITALEILRVPISGGTPTRLATIADFGGPLPAVSVSADGAIHLSRWVPGEARPSLWRIPPAGGAPLRIAEIPIACDVVSLVVGWNGRTATCTVDDFRGDAWTVDLGTATR